MALKPRTASGELKVKLDAEPIDVREYAAIKGISRQEAARELGEETEEDEAPAAGIGHNSGDDGAAAANLTKAAREKLKQVVAKIEKLEEEKKEVAEQIRDVYAEAKSMGYDTKALRGVIRLRKIDRQEREEQQAILDTYLHAIGELDFYD